MRKKALNKMNIFIMMIIFIVTISFNGMKYVDAKSLQDSVQNPQVIITAEQKEYKALVGETIDVKYTIKPKDIDIIKDNSQKEIVLVIDASNSMNFMLEYGQTRIDAVKEAAINFVTKFQGDENVKIGVVAYNYSAKNLINLTKVNGGYGENNVNSIIDAIDNITADGATNIGDGIRVGSSMFSENTGSNNVKKYLVLMSDGMPTSLTYTGVAGGYYCEPGIFMDKCYYDSINSNCKFYWLPRNLEENASWRYYEKYNDSNNVKYGTYGDEDPNNLCLNYSEIMSKRAKDNNIKNFIIGFTNESNDEKLKEIAKAGNAGYYKAKEGNVISEIYSQIGESIKSDFTLEDAKLKFNLPKGIELVDKKDIEGRDGSYEKAIVDINYEFDKSQNKYVAKPINVLLKLKGTKSAEYIIGCKECPISLAYKNNKGVVSTINMEEVKLKILKNDINFDLVRETLPKANNGTFKVNEEFNIEYTIKPNPIKLEKQGKKKEIVLVVDTSGSMNFSLYGENWSGTPRWEYVKDAINKFLDNFKNEENIKIGLVTYNDRAQVYNANEKKFFEKDELETLKQKINKIKPEGGTNLGDGIRKALWTLSEKNNSEKYMVMMTDGEPTFYSSRYGDWLTRYYYTEINNNDEEVNSSNDYNRGRIYSNLMAEKINSNKERNIKTFAIGFSKDADANVLKNIADVAGGSYKDATSKNKDVISEVYKEIEDEIKTDFTLKNVTLTENLTDGLVFVENEGNCATRSFNINYHYNQKTKQYEAEEKKIEIKVKGIKANDYSLNGDAILKYADLDGEQTKIFDKLTIKITDSQGDNSQYAIKHGVFQPVVSTKDMTGEENIKKLDDIAIIKDSLVRLGVLIKTSGQQLDAKIYINKNLEEDVKILKDVTATVYKVENGELKPTEIRTDFITNKNNAIIEVTLPKESMGKEAYYIINYNFKAEPNESIREPHMVCSCSVKAIDKDLDLKIKFSNLPDVF